MSLPGRKSRGVPVALAASLPALLLLAGCQMGPVAMRANRTLYNEALQDTANEQLLLNVVRLKYREPLSFLEVNAINTNYKFDAAGSLTFTDPKHLRPHLGGTAGGSHGGSVTGTYAEDPTFSYVPVQGEQFAKRIIGEMDMNTLSMLLRGGWHVDLFLRIAVERIGDLWNDPTVLPEPNEPLSSYERFYELSKLWRELQKRGDLALSIRPEEDEVVMERVPPEQVNPNLVLSAQLDNCRFVPHKDGTYEMRKMGGSALAIEVRYADEKEAQRADELLGVHIRRSLDAEGRPIERIRLRKPMGLQTTTSPASDVSIQVRSFVNVLFYLAQGVQVPESDVREGTVKVYRDAAGKVVDRRESIVDLLNIRCSPLPPLRAMVSVFYRGNWFYIDDADVSSKDTFALLGYIYAVQAGEVKGNAPLLTIPVSK
jgi:hypothetical protein